MPKIIGTEHEWELHRQLKLEYAGVGGRTEVQFLGFLVDAVTEGGEFIEVQTGHFGDIVKKAKALVPAGRLRIIHPILTRKYIELFDTEGELLRRTKSPRKGSPWDVFFQLIYAWSLPRLDNLAIELVLVEAVERRVADGKGSWRRKKVSILNRGLLGIQGRISLEKPADYLMFVPFARAEDFTSGDLAERAGISRPLAGKTLYVLTRLGIVRPAGKRGRSFLYRVAVTSRARKWKANPPVAD